MLASEKTSEISHDSVFAERCTERVVDVFAEDLIELAREKALQN